MNIQFTTRMVDCLQTMIRRRNFAHTNAPHWNGPGSSVVACEEGRTAATQQHIGKAHQNGTLLSEQIAMKTNMNFS